MSNLIRFHNLQLLDPTWESPRGGYEVMVEDGLIVDVTDTPLQSSTAVALDCGGRTLMPGLIDCHVHVVFSDVNIGNLEAIPLTLMAAQAATSMRAMLHRGFTTVRDTGGADWGLKTAVETGLLEGPRLFISGRAIGPTGGHSDVRRRTDNSYGHGNGACICCNAMVFSMALADGADEMRRTVRGELRKGADQIKIMCSGGVASPYDPLDSLQFSAAEIRAAVEEATDFGRYVLAHAYTPEAITRAVSNGVRTIEHGNLIDPPAAALLAEKDGFLVANLVAYYAMKEFARDYGMSEDMLEKNDLVIDGGLRSLEICKDAGVEVAFGSDLLGGLQTHQSQEFIYRSEVLSPIEIIRQATLTGAKIIRQEGKLGTISPGAHADLLLIDGNPVEDLTLFLDQGAHIPAIMKAGKMVKNTL